MYLQYSTVHKYVVTCTARYLSLILAQGVVVELNVNQLLKQETPMDMLENFPSSLVHLVRHFLKSMLSKASPESTVQHIGPD